ncbi:hypothetical protein KUCAC02_035210, partial [Chaenocephalus aceratus]
TDHLARRLSFTEVEKLTNPMHGPRRLEVGDVQSKQVTVRWEPFGYNVTRCYSYNLTVQYHYRPAGGASREPVKEEVVYDALSGVPQHILRNLPPFTNVSLKLVLSNPEGRKESEELLVLTDEDVPGAVPVDSIVGSSYEQQISLSWKEPLQTYGLIRHGKVFKPANETSHVFSGLFPGSTYSFTIRASTVKGFGPPVVTQFTTKISAPLMPAYDQESPLNQTDSTVTVLLKPAQSRGAPVSFLSGRKLNTRWWWRRSAPRRQRRGTAEILRCYPVPIHFQNASLLNSQYYFSAELPVSELRAARSFCIGDNRTYSGYWNAPLLPHKSYGIYYQAVSTANGETKIDCVRVATKAAIIATQLTTPYIRIAPAAGDKQLPEQLIGVRGVSSAEQRHKQPPFEAMKDSEETLIFVFCLENRARLALRSWSAEVFVSRVTGVSCPSSPLCGFHYDFQMEKRLKDFTGLNVFVSGLNQKRCRKLAKKRKETLSSRQEMTLMVNSSQCTTMVDTHTHTLNGRTVSSPSSFTLKTNTISTTVPNSYYPDPFVPTAILGELRDASRGYESYRLGNKTLDRNKTSTWLYGSGP